MLFYRSWWKFLFYMNNVQVHDEEVLIHGMGINEHDAIRISQESNVTYNRYDATYLCDDIIEM